MPNRIELINHIKFMDKFYRIDNGEFSNLKIDILMMEKILAQIEAMFSYYSRLVVFRFDLRQPEYTKNNAHLNRFFDATRKKALSTYKTKRMAYGWTREHNTQENQHYHCFIALDGRQVKNPVVLRRFMRQRWEFTENGSIHFPLNHIYKVMRDDKSNQLAPLIFRLSYLTKLSGKGYAGRKARNYSVSKIKHKQG